MRIIVIGAGHLGYIVSELLSNEGYDVVVVDSDEEKLEAIRNDLDVLTIHADGTSPSFMRSRDASKSDLLVAVTAMDEVNIIACMLAKKNGIPHTIARIRDPKFLSEPVDYIKENFDIDLVLSPELITAREISRLVMTPSAINVEDFAKGRVRLLEMKLSPRSPFAHKELKDITLPPSVLIALILRDHHMIIPHGSDRLLPLDNVYFLGNPESLAEISSHGHAKYQRRTKKALIIGAGRTGQALAPMLEKQGISVKIIDNNEDHCQQMAEKLKKGMVLLGDGTDMDLLTQEGVSEADTVICTTKDERLNLMMALLAKHLGAGQTMVRVTRTEYIALMQQVGIDIVLSTRLLAAGEVLAFVRSGSVVSVSLLEGARAEALEIVIPEGSKAAGKPLMKAGLPKSCLVGAYVRDGRVYIPDGHSVLSPGDSVILIAEADRAQDVISYFKGRD
ncbi:Trk system potassium transporter TrkA [uncultured Dialister sp.]|jgi:trk system potassium uptake protein TrkA|uniref:Trk system potassium transporter TrkA n=1 Tax=uncultured Dialister sp. TaxID=278064 RepID=UPI0025DD788F|nr:Trk system potassium transporter TrkA [uncultured Dialister sp.]